MKRTLFAAMALVVAMSFGACAKSGDPATASTTPGEKSAKSNKEGDAQKATAEGEKSAKSNKEGGDKSAKSNKEGDKGKDAANAGTTPDSAPKAP